MPHEDCPSDSPERQQWLARALLLCGPVSSALYLAAIDVAARWRHPAYHGYKSQMVSELMAAGAPTRRMLVGFFVPYNLLVFAFAGGIALGEARSKAGMMTALAMNGYGVTSMAGLLAYPMDARGTIGSRRDRIHITATVAMSSFIVAGMLSGAFLRGARFRAYTFATIGTVMVFGALAGYLARPMPGPTPGVGLAERVNIYATMLWFAMLGLVLRQAPHRVPRSRSANS